MEKRRGREMEEGGESQRKQGLSPEDDRGRFMSSLPVCFFLPTARTVEGP